MSWEQQRHRMVNQVRNREFARLVKIPSRTKRSMKERNLLEDCEINNLKEDWSQVVRERRKKELCKKLEIRELSSEKTNARWVSDIDNEGDWELLEFPSRLRKQWENCWWGWIWQRKQERMRSGATENFPTALKQKVQFWSKLKTVNWTNAKNAKEKKKKSQHRSWKGWSLENWSWSKGGLVFVCVSYLH